ncbi:gamma carbonic anhydrase family protein [Fusobacterium ulcerans]|uniref:gamma carbonic anhydrase family protein n=1 Tax=Fusobacterium ulcerans TaxID=861 RepID=UPI0026ED46E8|nr:gamma carbonic anhydrase family protein [Fusobacterium ulcerans]
MIYKLKNLVPKIGKNNYIADSATIIGNVETGDNVSIWFSAVLRADMSKITIGDNSNVQDNSTLHGDTEFSTTIGNGVTIGHNCVVHGCTVGDNSIIGMGSQILNGSIIPKNCIVSAGSVVNSKLKAEEGDLIAGVPAKVIKKLSEKNWEYLTYAKEVYLTEIKKYSEDLEEIIINEKD